MYFEERDRPTIDLDAFLATAVPKLLMASLIIFLNALAIAGLVRSNRWMSSIRSSGGKGFYFLPQSTQGLLHSLFGAYLAMGLLTLYAQVSLSAFVLLEWRFVEEQGMECLWVNCAIITLSIAISLHLVSLAVDRTLASHLSYSRYTALAGGTVPLWLLAIWLPSGIIGSLPLAGWRNSFTFCVFIHQFNDDYIKFVGGFHFAAIAAIPFVYFHIKCWLKPSQVEMGTLYRWHRKLQSHHRLTFISTVALNIVCWSPFHLYLLLACQSCPFPAFGVGFLQDYFFVVALVPAIAIPMLFTIRGSVLDQCASAISKVFSRNIDTNPLSSHSSIQRKSSLFTIDDRISAAGASSIYRDTLTTKQKGNLFVPRYLPMDHTTALPSRNGKYAKNPRQSWRASYYSNNEQYSNKAFEREYSQSPSTQETTDFEEPYYSQIQSLPRQ